MLFATAGSNSVGRSHSIQFFHGSEVAYWPNAEDHLSSILMAISVEKGSEIILESTANGRDGMFYELCTDALKKKNDFQFIFLPWYWHSEYFNNTTSNWEVSKEWLEYQQAHKLALNQIRWAYLKNQILCKVTGEDAENGPSTQFKREFPASSSEAFSSKNDDNFISAIDIGKIALSLHEYNAKSANPEVAKLIKIKQQLNYNEPIILGVDVARGGGDFSWIIDRKGDFLGFNVNQKVNINDTMQVAYWVKSHIDNVKPARVFIDAGGGGIAVVDRLFELGLKGIVEAINFAEKPYNQQKFLNKRAEIWSNLKDFIKGGGYIINDPKLLGQIASVKYQYNLKGQLQLESKRFISSQFGKSPDGADAAALTFAGNFSAKNIISNNKQYISTKSYEYDPFTW